jgi:tetratricopeptide (TPR) repeat protein
MDPASEARALFERREYSKGFGILNKALSSRTINPVQRAEALKTLAEFYEEFMGNPDGALRLYKKIMRTRLHPGHPLKLSARDQIARLNSLEDKYRRQNAILKRSRITAGRQKDETKITEQITRLEQLIQANPEYYKLAEAYYCLALNYMSLEQYGKSQRLFRRCKRLKPCIDYYLPVTARARVARNFWMTSAVTETACTVAGVLLILTALVFYGARPWRWMRPKHVACGLVMAFLWWAVFYASYGWLGHSFEVTEKAIAEIAAERPSFVSAKPASPGSVVTRYLFVYGLVGVLAMFVFAAGLAKLKRRWAVFIINSLFGLLLFASLTAVYYMRHCHQKTRFNSQADGGLYYPKGCLYFVLDEPEPYILTNPKAYPGLNTRNIADSYLREWVEQNCPPGPSVRKGYPLKAK